MAPWTPSSRFLRMLVAMLGGVVLLGVGTVVLKGWTAGVVAAAGLGLIIYCGFRAILAYDDEQRRLTS